MTFLQSKYIGRMIMICLIVIGLVYVAYLYSSWQVLSHADDYLTRAEKHLTNRNPAAAARELKALLKYDANHWKAQLLLGQSQFVQQQFSAAEKALSQIPQTAPEYRAASIGMTRCYLNTARMQQAEVQLKRHLKLFPREQYALTELQWLYFNQLRERELLDHLLYALSESDNKAMWLFHLLTVAYKRPIPQELFSLLRQIDHAAPDQPSIVLALGHCYWKMGDISKARDHFKRAQAMRPDDLETSLLAAEFHLELGELDTAEQLLDSQEQAGGENSNLQSEVRMGWLKSRIAFRRQDYQTAEQAIQSACKLRPYEIKYLQLLNKLYLIQGNKTESHTLSETIRELAVSDEHLSDIVASGQLEKLTPELCGQIATHCRILGRENQARGWSQLASTGFKTR